MIIDFGERKPEAECSPGEAITMPKRYRKKPVTIEAMQWNGTSQGAIDIIQWILSNGGSGCLWCSDPDRCSKTGGDCPHTIRIRTLEGDMHASLGDYIIRGVQGEFYPCKPDIFKETYEVA